MSSRIFAYIQQKLLQDNPPLAVRTHGGNGGDDEYYVVCYEDGRHWKVDTTTAKTPDDVVAAIKQRVSDLPTGDYIDHTLL
jgi:hypothetical protein